MLKRTLVILILALTQAGCSIEEGGGLYDLIPMTEDGRQLHERDKRELLKIEDLKLGSGPLAAWGRKISADIEVRYTDGTVVYRGPMFIYSGFRGSVFIHNAITEAGLLSFGQTGILSGINGMAVGGKRRIIIEAELVSSGLLVQGCRPHENVGVRKEKLIVEATLTASCIPVLLRAIKLPTSRYMIEREVWCNSSSEPQRSPSDPIWHLY